MANGTPPWVSHCPPNGWKSPAWMRPLVRGMPPPNAGSPLDRPGMNSRRNSCGRPPVSRLLSTYPSMPYDDGERYWNARPEPVASTSTHAPSPAGPRQFGLPLASTRGSDTRNPLSWAMP